MKPFRAILATAVAAGALVVLPTQPASACVLGFGSGCPVFRIYPSGEHNFGVRVEEAPNFDDPTKYAQPTSPEKVQQNRFREQSHNVFQDWLAGGNGSNWEQLGGKQRIGFSLPETPASGGGGGNEDILCAFDYRC